ncbi:hypothetical protein [Roseivirga misakiensis]|uniref:hypothetical protein n=1 Tax=Roseivirga misakiensis TaxID=1563681 RepID=UPI00114CABBD|nr:hypothetical protein [Roseivirga misakiensis]
MKTLFEEGKQLFDQEQYALALAKFAPLTSLDQSNDMVRYAAYFYAISAHKSGDNVTAKNMFLQVLRKYPNWDVTNDINYWLGFLAAERGDLSDTFSYLAKAETIDTKQKNAVKQKALLGEVDMGILKELLAEYPEDNLIASKLANGILALDVEDQDIDLLNELQSTYSLDLDLSIDGIESSPKKSTYNVGLFLPFAYSSDSARLVRSMTTWTTRMYQGVSLGVDKLKEEGIDLNLITIDTRNSETRLFEMIRSGELDDLDLIIGPVTQSAVQLITGFSKNKRINMVNPLSSNSDILTDNPFAFLYYPSNESLAIKAADYARVNFTRNKNVAVFYSGFADKARADLYKQIIEKDSFNVTIFQEVRENESAYIQTLLSEEHEQDKDSAVVANMIAEMDSLREAGEEDWEIYMPRDFVYDTLKILPDSIGHVFIASDFSSLASSALSGIESRPDTVEYLSSSRFLSTENSISFDQLERLNATFIGSNLIDYTTDEVSTFRELYVEKYLASPIKEDRLGDAYIGYDITVTFGRLLQQYGKYFQIGLKRKDVISGELTDKFNYKFSNDNRYTPVLKVKEGVVVPVEKH